MVKAEACTDHYAVRVGGDKFTLGATVGLEAIAKSLHFAECAIWL